MINDTIGIGYEGGEFKGSVDTLDTQWRSAHALGYYEKSSETSQVEKTLVVLDKLIEGTEDQMPSVR